MNTILDLFMTSCSMRFEHINTVINKKISDHNLMTIRCDYDIKNVEDNVRKNCYMRSIYEYDINVNHDGWKHFYENICNISSEYLDDLSHDDLIEYLYQLVDDNAKKFLEKKKCFSESISKRKIPIKIRRLLRKKARLSKKVLSSSSWRKNYSIQEELENVERQLYESYKERRMKIENEALENIKNEPSLFLLLCKKI